MSTVMGFGELIVAKWKSIMRHVDNKHSEHPDPLFPKCAHNEIEPRQWIKIGNILFLFYQVIPFSINRFFLIAWCWLKLPWPSVLSSHAGKIVASVHAQFGNFLMHH